MSAEIVVIALGTVQSQTIQMQTLVVSTIALLITFGVYGLVAGIVKIDDAGLYLVEKSEYGSKSSLLNLIGKGMLAFAPKLMKTLTVVGTVAMLLVGGGIFTHGIPALHHLVELSSDTIETLPTIGHFLSQLSTVLINMTLGFIVGAIIYFVIEIIQKLKAK